MTTHRTLRSKVNRTGLLRIESVQIRIRVLDARSAYGRTDLLIEPLAGEGSQWVQEGRVSLDPPPRPVVVEDD